jgi:hypothetical protein
MLISALVSFKLYGRAAIVSSMYFLSENPAWVMKETIILAGSFPQLWYGQAKNGPISLDLMVNEKLCRRGVQITWLATWWPLAWTVAQTFGQSAGT